MISIFSHDGPIYKHDNTSVYMNIKKASRGTSVESTVEAFSRGEDGRGAFLALISNHEGDIKYRPIPNNNMNLLQNINWNGCSYPLDTSVYKHRQAVEDI